MMLEDVLEDPRPSWGRAFAAGFGAAALVALLVEVGPDVAEAPDWWGFTTAAVAPTAIVAFRVAGGVSWRVAVRGAAALVLVFGAGLGLALVADATDNMPVYLLAAAVLGLALAAVFRGRREPLPHVPAPVARPDQPRRDQLRRDPDPAASAAEPLPARAAGDDDATALERDWLDEDEPNAVRAGHQRGWFDENGDVVTGSTPAVEVDAPAVEVDAPAVEVDPPTTGVDGDATRRDR